MEMLRQTLIGSAVGIVGTGLGGCVCCFFNPTKGWLAVMMAFAAGVMSSVTALELIPQAFAHSGVIFGLVSIAFGMLFVYSISLLYRTGQSSSLIKTGIITGITIAVHNFPEGLAIGSGFSESEATGAGIALVILLHDLPEGMAMAAPLKAGGMGNKVALSAFLAGAPTGFGAFLGFAMGSISKTVYGACMGFAGGAMMQATIAELLPQSVSSGGKLKAALGMALGMAVGAAAVCLL